MNIRCVWEHNGNDTLLYSIDFPGAYTRGENLETAMRKMSGEIKSYMSWCSRNIDDIGAVEIVQDSDCTLDVCDADSDVLFESETEPLSVDEYQRLKALTLKSAADFLTLYLNIPDKHLSVTAARRTFYGWVPCTAEDMYLHTKLVNDYYFGEIGVVADNDGTIFECRRRGFAALEQQEGFLYNPVTEGSYGEMWSLRKVLRRFIWHDRIHAKAMYRMAVRIWGSDAIPDIFAFRMMDDGLRAW